MATTKPTNAAWSLLALLLDEVVDEGAAAVESARSAEDVTVVEPEDDVPFVALSLSWKMPPCAPEDLVADGLRVALDKRGVDVGDAVVEALLVVTTSVVLVVLSTLLDEVVVELLVVVEEELEELVASACKPSTLIWDVVGSACFEVDVSGSGSGAALELEELDEPDEPPPVDPSVLKRTMLADPDVTVTTQKSAPPAPVADSALVTAPNALEPGSISQGSPTQEPSHSILSPNLGLMPA